MTNVLEAKTRDNLKKSVTKALRENGQVPAVLYGNKTESKTISVDSIEFMKLMREVGRNGLITLKADDQSEHQVLVYDLQIDPLKAEYNHIDFFAVDMKSEIDANVPIKLIGDAPAEKEGGVVSQLLYELSVRCLPTDIPEELEVDISELAIGDTLSVADIRSKVTVEVMNEDDEAVVTGLAPTLEPSGDEEGTEEQQAPAADEQAEDSE